MGGTDSRGTALAADAGLGRRQALFGEGDRSAADELVEAAVGHDIAGLNSLHRGIPVIGDTGCYGLLHDVVLRPPAAVTSAVAAIRARAGVLTRATARGCCALLAGCGAGGGAGRHGSRARLNQMHESDVAVVRTTT